MGITSFFKSLFGGSGEPTSNTGTDGYGLSAENPILLSNIVEAYALLGRLQTSDGKKLSMQSRSSMDGGASVDYGIVDRYSLVDSAGRQHTIYMYCYHHTSVVKAPPGFKII